MVSNKRKTINDFRKNETIRGDDREYQSINGKQKRERKIAIVIGQADIGAK